MKARELRDLTPEELEQRFLDTRQEYFNLRVQKATGQLEKPVRLRMVRRELARARTLLNERKPGAER